MPRGTVGALDASRPVQSKWIRQPTGAFLAPPVPGTGAPLHSMKFPGALSVTTGDRFVIGGSPPPPPPPSPPPTGVAVCRGWGEGTIGEDGDGTTGWGVRAGMGTTMTGIGPLTWIGE